MNLKTTLLLLPVLLATLLLTSCAHLLGPRDVEVPLSTLQASLNNRFPLNNRYLELFDINISSPRLAFQPGTNRIVTTLDAAIAPMWIKKSWKGNFALSGVLALDSARQAVILTDPRVENMNIDGVDPSYANQVAKIGGFLATQVFKDIPLYTFTSHDFRYGGTSFFPTKINTKTNGLVVTFEPVR